MGSFVSIKNRHGVYKHFGVPKEVYVYICQLENAVKCSASRRKIRELYPERFNKESTRKSTIAEDAKRLVPNDAELATGLFDGNNEITSWDVE